MSSAGPTPAVVTLWDSADFALACSSTIRLPAVRVAKYRPRMLPTYGGATCCSRPSDPNRDRKHFKASLQAPPNFRSCLVSKTSPDEERESTLSTGADPRRRIGTAGPIAWFPVGGRRPRDLAPTRYRFGGPLTVSRTGRPRVLDAADVVTDQLVEPFALLAVDGDEALGHGALLSIEPPRTSPARAEIDLSPTLTLPQGLPQASFRN